MNQTLNMSDSDSSVSSIITEPVKNFHRLHNKWTLYAHLPHDTDWSINSYKSILEMENLEQCISLFEAIPREMTQNCMLFLMKDDIKPLWEDIKNKKGGSFSFKVQTSEVHSTWKELCYAMIGNTVSNDTTLKDKLNGITISPKRNFCIIKLWMSDCSIKTLTKLKNISNIKCDEALFKKHNPEY